MNFLQIIATVKELSDAVLGREWVTAFKLAVKVLSIVSDMLDSGPMASAGTDDRNAMAAAVADLEAAASAPGPVGVDGLGLALNPSVVMALVQIVLQLLKARFGI